MALTDYVIMPGEDYQAICDAVREKRNETEVIKSGEIAGKIQGIEVKPVLQEKSVDPGIFEQSVTPDEGYDGLSMVHVDAVKLRYANVTPDVNGPVNVTPGAGYDGLDLVVVDPVMLQDKTVTPTVEAQTVTADEGYHGLGTIIIEGDAELLPENIKEGINIFGVEGTAVTSEVDWLTKFIGETRVALMRGEIINDEYHVEHKYVRTTTHMFGSCTNLTSVPLFDTSNVTSMNGMFNNCTSLITVPLFDTSSVTNMNTMFNNCTSLTTVPLFDTTSVTGANNMFYNCSSLTECWLRNIKANLQVGSGTSWGHLLTLDSLIHLIKECRDTGSQKTLTIGRANLEKIANVYVRLIDITDEMRAEDNLIDEKLPFEVCESTDEGAMLITDYAAEKNWAIA